MSARDNLGLGLALLSIASELAAVQHRRQEIEDQEIIFRAEGPDAHPLLTQGVNLRTLQEMMSQGKVGRDVRVWRRLRHPENERALQDEARRLDARSQELRELQTWIEQELQNLKQESAA